jgi:hypothetical protein
MGRKMFTAVLLIDGHDYPISSIFDILGLNELSRCTRGVSIGDNTK